MGLSKAFTTFLTFQCKFFYYLLLLGMVILVFWNAFRGKMKCGRSTKWWFPRGNASDGYKCHFYGIVSTNISTIVMQKFLSQVRPLHNIELSWLCWLEFSSPSGRRDNSRTVVISDLNFSTLSLDLGGKSRVSGRIKSESVCCLNMWWYVGCIINSMLDSGVVIIYLSPSSC